MSAKHKLNAANLMGVFVIAGVLGAVTASWSVFLITGIALMISAVYSGDIRR